MTSRIFVLLVLFLPVAACSTTSGAVGKATGAAANALIPPEKEEKLGEKFSADVEKDLTLHSDDKVQTYIRDLGKTAVRAAGGNAPDGIEFEFKVVDDPDTVNAFAGPGGQIYFYTGLIQKADNSAEVMGVMAHEVAHVTERHIAEQLVASYGVQALANAALGDKPGLIEKLGATVAAKGFLMKYGRDQESEADSMGFKFITQTDWSPHGMVTFFQKLEGGGIPDFLSTHPSPDKRVSNLRGAIRNFSGKTGDNLGDSSHADIVSRVK